MDFLEETIKVLVIDGPGRLGKVITDLGSGKSVLLSDGLNTNLEKINFFIIFPGMNYSFTIFQGGAHQIY